MIVLSDGVCPCGASRITVRGEPLARFICHCCICQEVYQAPHADVTVVWAGSVSAGTPRTVQYRRYRPPPALQRGTCRECGSPVVGYLRIAPMARLAFVPTRNLTDRVNLRAPAFHVFYDRRVADAADDLPKWSGYWLSEMAVVRAVMAGAIGRST